MPKPVPISTIAPDTPDGLKVYKALGLDIRWREGSKSAETDCAFCGKLGHTNIEVATTKFRCVVCGVSGNNLGFIRQLWQSSMRSTTRVDYARFAGSRGIHSPSSLEAWGLCRSIITRHWLIPGYGPKGLVSQLYRWVIYKGRGKLMLTPTLGQQLHGVNLYDKRKDTIFLCEGVWDGVRLWEVLGTHKRGPNGLTHTGNPKQSLLASSNVLAVPGCNMDQDGFARYLPLFAGKTVNIIFDNDHPRKHPITGARVTPPSYAGMRSTARVLYRASPPVKLNIVQWGPGGFNPDLPDGYDVKDKLSIKD